MKPELVLIAGFVACAGAAGYFAAPEAANILPPGKDMLFWTPPQQAIAYKSFARIYASRTVRHGSDVLALPKGAELRVTYEEAGATKTTEDFMHDNSLFGLLVLHKGQIRLERYGKGFTASDRWTSFSIAKSMTSTLLGAAV